MSYLSSFSQDIFVFVSVVIIAFLIDLFAHKKDEVITLKSAVYFSIFWVGVSVAFGGYLYMAEGSEFASLFFAGYALEKALSVDNLFVMMAIFKWFSVPEIYRHRVLYYGVLGAIVFRLIFVLIGTSLMALSHWVEVIFALIIAYTAIVMLKGGEDKGDEDYSQHLAYRLVHKFFPVFPRLVGHKFFITREFLHQNLKQNVAKSGALIATPLFLCLCVVELSDIMFAFDSVPAVIAISSDPLIVYSAMIFAVLGLRTLYFVLEALKNYLIHLEKAVIVLLFFIAIKLFLNATSHIFGFGFEISPNMSLVVVLSVLFCGIVSSFIFKK
ncbi:TerC/Alx family metal homeostasis membrane protein [Campylobacter mucosalis]|uniref:TerC/Alx family metal homeostasis membrane protein n=1 Tax=Campylobacter mucosalis TaxID=202 RepID=UPI001B8D4BA8|nr:TerC/Alx family metal homeostasis membrane protein [Campylobacter mucosalis]